MNKKATEKVVSVYWFFILFIVAGAVVFMVSAFYGSPYDVREMEEKILSDKVADCVSSGGYINSEILEDENFKNNFLDRCDLTFEVEDQYGWSESSEYYLNIGIYEFNYESDFDRIQEDEEVQLGEKLFEVEEGSINLKSFYNSDSNDNSKERKMYVLDEEGNQYVIKVLSIVRKTEKNE